MVVDGDHGEEQDGIGHSSGDRRSSDRGCVFLDASSVETAGVGLLSGVHQRWIKPVFSWADRALGKVGEAQASAEAPLDTRRAVAIRPVAEDAVWAQGEVSVLDYPIGNARSNSTGSAGAGIEWPGADGVCGAAEPDAARVDRAVVEADLVDGA